MGIEEEMEGGRRKWVLREKWSEGGMKEQEVGIEGEMEGGRRK